MSNLKEIRRRITSVQNTKQITRAMKLVSAAKLRRAQDSATNGREYALELKRAICALIPHIPNELRPDLLTSREKEKKVTKVIIGGERGLCGAYNANMAKAIEKEGDELSSYIAIGSRVVSNARRLKWNMEASYESLEEDVSFWPIKEIVEGLIEDFTSQKTDKVYVYYTKFNSALSQEVSRFTLLPVSEEELIDPDDSSDASNKSLKTDQSYPNLLKSILPLYLFSQFRQAALESKASEHAARMTAMESATKNATDLIDNLKLTYNRARQSAITSELIDIVGGAEAVK